MLQVDELQAAPTDERDRGLSAPELALDRELNAAPVPSQDCLMNDLTSMVVMKKRRLLLRLYLYLRPR